jgi:HAD superfamily hydrolase (TIGR01549 family)
MTISTILLDFDGVLMESVNIKTEAFKKLFSFSPDHIDEITRFHLKNGGMSRFEKFRYIYRNILKKDLSDEQFAWLSDKFSQLVKEEVIRAPFVPGAEEFLKKYQARIDLYIVSATPEYELKEIIDRRQLTKYFKAVFGSPASKADHINEIIMQTGADSRTVVFVGDAKNDCVAAETAGVRFIGRVPPNTLNPFSSCTSVECMVADLEELATILESELC